MVRGKKNLKKLFYFFSFKGGHLKFVHTFFFFLLIDFKKHALFLFLFKIKKGYAFVCKSDYNIVYRIFTYLCAYFKLKNAAIEKSVLILHTRFFAIIGSMETSPLR